MAIPKIKKEDIFDALKFIDQKGIPEKNKSIKYSLLTENGKKYPPMYVIAVANHIAHGVEITTEGYNAVEAKNFLQSNGFQIEVKQEKYKLTITADNITSTDDRFTMDNLVLGNNYKPLDVFFQKANGEIIRRNYNKGEQKISNQTMPRIAFQIFEKQIELLSVEEKNHFPICKYNPSSNLICGIFSSVEELQKYNHSTSLEYMRYYYENGQQFVIYCWNLFSTILFVQECLKRFGASRDCFVLTYEEKEENKMKSVSQSKNPDDSINSAYMMNRYRNPYSAKLIESKNIILRGAPGTGKSHLAKQIAADIISNGYFDDDTMLSEEQKKQIEFVQFHPSYDYSDFVEGLRPKINDDGSMGFALQDGIFKKFVERARRNYENSLKSTETLEKETSVQEAITNFFSNVEFGIDAFQTVTGNEFFIESVDDEHIHISIPGNAIVHTLCLNIDDIRKMLESGKKFEKVKDVSCFFEKTFASQAYSYDFALYKKILERMRKSSKAVAKQEELKKYIFIIDEINRGEISKIFGELFFAIDPGYRGQAGEVSTQYSNLHSNPDRKFFVPENVYIIGTMNDIDKSVDSFDFAMRRRFRFIELKVNEHLEMLASLENKDLEAEAIRRMKKLNEKIVDVEELNENYQIGASYFLKLKTLDFDQLWTDYLQPLLKEYIHGMYNEENIMKDFAQAYGYHEPNEGNKNEATKN